MAEEKTKNRQTKLIEKLFRKNLQCDEIFDELINIEQQKYSEQNMPMEEFDNSLEHALLLSMKATSNLLLTTIAAYHKTI